ncbi:MAG: phosphate signaling complex protein PhoU [Candidatus Omnitrophota bacterium]
MRRHFHDELKALKQELLRMGLLAEEAIEKAARAVLLRDRKLAEEAFRLEKETNRLEIEIDDKGHNLLALGQPMAVDLRLITMILKINTDLERIGDHAVNIAERAIRLIGDPPMKKVEDTYLTDMAAASQRMLREALDAFINEDVERAQRVLASDDEVDGLNDAIYIEVNEKMQKDPSIVKAGMNIVMIGHNLERIGDLANNIAEDVIYLKEGKEVRHHSD